MLFSALAFPFILENTLWVTPISSIISSGTVAAMLGIDLSVLFLILANLIEFGAKLI